MPKEKRVINGIFYNPVEWIKPGTYQELSYKDTYNKVIDIDNYLWELSNAHKKLFSNNERYSSFYEVSDYILVKNYDFVRQCNHFGIRPTNYKSRKNETGFAPTKISKMARFLQEAQLFPSKEQLLKINYLYNNFAFHTIRTHDTGRKLYNTKEAEKETWNLFYQNVIVKNYNNYADKESTTIEDYFSNVAHLLNQREQDYVIEEEVFIEFVKFFELPSLEISPTQIINVNLPREICINIYENDTKLSTKEYNDMLTLLIANSCKN